MQLRLYRGGADDSAPAPPAPTIPAVHAASPPGDNGGMGPSAATTVNQLAAYWREIEGERYVGRAFRDKDYYVTLFCLDLGERAAEDVWVQDVLRWVASNPSERHADPAVKRKRTWGPGTRKNVARTIVHLFNLARKHGLISRHNLESLMENFEDSEPRRPVAEEELARMLEHATDDAFRHLLLTIRENGCRPGEAEAIKYPMIHWIEGYAKLDRHKTVKKTRKPRIVPLSDWTLELFGALRMAAKDPTGHVLLNSEGRPWSAQTVSKRMKTLRKRAQIPDDAFVHGLRKTAITGWVASGMSVKLAAQIAGHANTQVTEKDYINLDRFIPQLREAMSKHSAQ